MANQVEVRSLSAQILLPELQGIRSIMIDDDAADPHEAAKAKVAKLPEGVRRYLHMYVFEVPENGCPSLAYCVDKLEHFLFHFPKCLRSGTSRLKFYTVPPDIHKLAKRHLIQMA